MQERKQAKVLGLPIDLIDEAGAVARLAEAIEHREPVQVITLNAEMCMLGLADPAFRQAVEASGLVIPDGAGVIWALGRQGQKIKRLPGIELSLALLQRAATEGWRVYVLGASPEVNDLAVAEIRRRHPRLQLVGARHGFFAAEAEGEILAGIRSAAPDILLVALGVPRQEFWIARHQASLGVPVAVGVGGTLDVLAGKVSRAPKLMQRLNLEWLYRLYKEPWRWRRMGALPRFVGAVLREN